MAGLFRLFIYLAEYLFQIQGIFNMIIRKFSTMVPAKAISFILLLGFSLPGISQMLRINFEDIPQKTIRKFIKAKSIDKIPDFSTIHSSWNADADQSEFHYNEKVFYFKDVLQDVWDGYSNVNLTKCLLGRSIRFGLLISKCSNSVIYSNNSSFIQLDTGQVYFFDLRFIRGLINIPVAFEVTSIDHVNQIIEFSYLDINKSRGKQTMQFSDGGNGMTMIVHRTYFKSNSKVRDNLLYPHFHKRFITQYHRNMKHLLKI